MNKRPKRGEDEDEILRMQEEFLKEKSKNRNLQPSAQVVNLRPAKRSSTESKSSDNIIKTPSKYAQAKGLRARSEKRQKTEVSTSSVMGDIVEKNLEDPPENRETVNEDDKVYFPKPIPCLLGDVVERNTDNIEVDFSFEQMPSQGFPAVTKRDLHIQPGSNIIQTRCIERQDKPTVMDIDQPTTSASSAINVPLKSAILSSKDAEQIHQENINIINKMSEKEILEEQQKLISSLDPKLVEFLKAKRKQSSSDSALKPDSKKVVHFMDTTSDIELKSKNTDNAVQDMDMTESQETIDDSLWENDVLSHPEVSKWLHFDSLEKDKLEWMKGVEESKSKTNEPYEARFDFKGYLLPYTMEYTEKTKTLYHHGDEPHRPGYTLSELFELSRSTITQQRIMALNTIAGLLEYYMAGTYKDIIELPISKIFFVVRIAMDENKVVILEPALKAMRNLLYNRTDEASLDALLGFEEGRQQPCLENDKSEIEYLDSKETEFKDFHLAEIDLISALLRTDILQRLFYILETVKPNFNCIQYSLQILTRLARDSVETAARIVETTHLLQTVMKNFVPVTSINFAFKPEFVYKRMPVLAALKLLRVLSLQTKEIGEVLCTKYNIIQPLSAYISSGVEGLYGLRILIEVFCIMSNLLYFGVAVDSALSLSPIITLTLYKHVKGTDIFIDSSVISATHAAVVFQFVNNVVKSSDSDALKQEVYPLIKEGIQKWMSQISSSENYTCAHLKLLCAALDCCKTIFTETLEMKFLVDSLKVLVDSRGFKQIVDNLVPSSNLLSDIDHKSLHFTQNLMSLGSSLIDSSQKVLPLLNVVSPVPFLASLFDLLTFVNDRELALSYIDHVTGYLRMLEKKTPSLCENWFTRIETDLIIAIVKRSVLCNIPESRKDLLYSVANKLCYVLRADKHRELEYIFNNVIFDKHWFTAERLINLVSLSDEHFSEALSSVEDIKNCYRKVINFDNEDFGRNVMLRKWQEPILTRDWMYLPILSLYSKSQETETAPKVTGEHAKKVAAQIAAEKEKIVRSSLEWILFNEWCFPDHLDDISVTDRFCRIMCVFLCDNSLFLDPKIKTLLHKCTSVLFRKKAGFNFDEPLTGLNNFQDFYTQFLEQFQAVSYGDHTFAACVLVPLAQQHNMKWRKLLWSEYAGCLRALDCPEELLCYNISDYLYPEETDESLIKSYLRALSSDLLRPNTIAHKIASHHVESFRKRKNLS